VEKQQTRQEKKKMSSFCLVVEWVAVFYAGLAISCVQPASPCFDKWMDGSDQASAAAAADVTFLLFVSLPLY
jgi:membrane protein required for beta-lactamase induction